MKITRTELVAFCLGCTTALAIAAATMVSAGDPPAYPPDRNQELLDTIQGFERTLHRATNALESHDAGSAATTRVAVSDASPSLLHLKELEKAIEKLALKTSAIPPVDALSFDIGEASPRAQTRDTIKRTSTDLVADAERTVKNHLLMTMRECLQRFGKPDAVMGGAVGESVWNWETDDGHSVEVYFLWGRIRYMRGGVPSK